MRHVPRICIPDITLASGISLKLDKDVRHRLVNVSRVREKQQIILFNGQETVEASAVITELTRKHITLEILSLAQTATESPLKTRLCQALEKSDRMDYAIQKSVELGVSEIQPMLTTHSLEAPKEQRLEKKMAHWRGVIMHACEQSGRSLLPVLHEPILFSDLLQNCSKQATTVMPDPDADAVLADITINAEETIDILIGPIGGFSKEELTAANNQGLQCVRLGPRILRTETAGPALLAILQSGHGDWA